MLIFDFRYLLNSLISPNYRDKWAPCSLWKTLNTYLHYLIQRPTPSSGCFSVYTCWRDTFSMTAQLAYPTRLIDRSFLYLRCHSRIMTPSRWALRRTRIWQETEKSMSVLQTCGGYHWYCKSTYLYLCHDINASHPNQKIQITTTALIDVQCGLLRLTG